MLAEPCRKLLTRTRLLALPTAIARFFRGKVLAAGDGLDEDDTLVIAEVYAGAQITGAVPNHEIL